LGSEEVEITSGGGGGSPTVRWRVAEALSCGTDESAVFTISVTALAAEVGVPLITPVAEVRASPPGSEPFKLQV
jgi:hypothetical protein